MTAWQIGVVVVTGVAVLGLFERQLGQITQLLIQIRDLLQERQR